MGATSGVLNDGTPGGISPMTNNGLTSVVAAMVASVCFGTAAVLESIGAKRIDRARAIEVRLLFRLAGSRPYVLGVRWICWGSCSPSWPCGSCRFSRPKRSSPPTSR